MYDIVVERHFDAAHYLRGYRGKCEALHGHRFRVLARVRAQGLNEIGIAYDFAELKRHLDDILGKFDHTCLNDTPLFERSNPSSENLAAVIFSELKERLTLEPLAVSSVEVWESPFTGVVYQPGAG
ncbi:MAG: 6-carboxytetrahydropterin synthase QueD [Chloroflexi bacterium]|nr:6-carboxytetrahydropterin synthase QueD [Chloroflexota bacterium]